MRPAPPPKEFLLALVTRAVLGVVDKVARVGRREPGAAAVPRVEPVPPPRTPLLLAMLGCFALGLPLMIVFEFALTRILGVALMFAFIVMGVFLIANPAFLGQEED